MPVQFFRLRPSNFPTLRLSQLANLYYKNQNLFSKIIALKTKEDYYDLCSVSASKFWDTHYTFSTISKHSKKKITSSFIELLLINTIIPIKFSYDKYHGRTIDEELVLLSESIKPEKNTIIDTFNTMKKITATSLQSQALLQLKNRYCNQNKCLQCAVVAS